MLDLRRGQCHRKENVGKAAQLWSGDGGMLLPEEARANAIPIHSQIEEYQVGDLHPPVGIGDLRVIVHEEVVVGPKLVHNVDPEDVATALPSQGAAD